MTKPKEATRKPVPKESATLVRLTAEAKAEKRKAAEKAKKDREAATKSVAADKERMAGKGGDTLAPDMIGPAKASEKPGVIPDEIARSLSTIKIAFTAIVLDKNFNSRKDYRGIEQLSQDIAEAGLISALVVYRDAKDPTLFHLIAGFRRTLAILRLREDAKKAGMVLPFDEIEVKVYEGPELGRWILNLRENMSRVDLHPWEIGDQCVRIRERFQLSGAQIGERLSYQKSHVNNCIRIVEKIAKDVQDEFRIGKAEPPFNFLITLAAMVLADGKPDHERQRQKWQEYIGAKSKSDDDGGGAEGGGDGDDGGDEAKMRRLREAEKCLAKLEEGLKEAKREEVREYFRGAIAATKYLMGLVQKIKGVSFAKK
jgi:ParB-like chromosome segregation protein Spo0J